jgi:hypothetical protein
VQLHPAEVSRAITSAPKASKTILAVKFGDGTVFFERKAADTFAKALAKMGFQLVSALKMRVNNFPLVSTERSDSMLKPPLMLNS